MKRLFIILIVVLPMLSIGAANVHLLPNGSLGGSSKVCIQLLDAQDTVIVNGNMLSTGMARVVVSEQFYDGMGNLSSEVLYAGSEGKNTVHFVETDYSGNIIKDWLPVPIPQATDINLNNIQSFVVDFYGDNNPYKFYKYETFGDKRLLQSNVEGETYTSHPTIMSYATNDDEEVIRWIVEDGHLNCIGYWQAGMLSSKQVMEPDGARVSVYENPQGQTVLRRDNAGDTYYVYDRRGLLRYILPPLAVISLQDAGWDVSEDVLHLYAYLYQYDCHGELVEKRPPGCEPIRYIYDQYGRLSESQDGSQRQRGDFWIRMEYDDYGRNIRVKEINHSNAAYEKLLVEWYYDDYSFLNGLPSAQRQSIRFHTYATTSQSYYTPNGLLTAEKVYGLEENVSFITSYYYDQRGQCIQKNTHNPQYEGYSINTTYNHDGSISCRQCNHLGLLEEYTYNYDSTGRQVETYYKFDVDQEVCMSRIVYDELGRPTSRFLHNNEVSCLDSFDLRGNLKYHQQHDLVEKLYYAENLPNEFSPKYNGLISGAELTHNNETQKWVYSYDNCNRLTFAEDISQGGRAWREICRYDEQGNITNLFRGDEDEPYDDLSYQYHGNQLINIQDVVGHINYYNTKEYADLSQADTTMRYDANGNLIVDLDRDISCITYNLFNLPDTIQFHNGNMIINLYDALGVKYGIRYITLAEPLLVPAGSVIDLQKEEYSEETIDYIENLEIKSYGTSHEEYVFQTETGFVKCDNTGIKYFCLLKDHLGNVCEVFDVDEHTAVQHMWYYPSGLPLSCSTNQGFQTLKYNGQPYEEMHGFDVYDYGFRGYYASAERFTSMDPLAEQTPWLSPYLYANANPVCNIDWMGLSAVLSNDSRNVPTCEYVVINKEGKVLAVVFNSDYHIYLADNQWKKGDNVAGLVEVGLMVKAHLLYLLDSYLRKPAPGIYYKNLHDISVSSGVTFGARIALGPESSFDLNIGSINLLKYSTTPNNSKLNYLGGNTIVTNGINLGVITAQHSFNVDSNLGYISSSENSSLSLSVSMFGINSNGFATISFSAALGIGFDISIQLYMYYN